MEGLFTEDEASDFFKEYEKEMSLIKLSQYFLEMDCTAMDTESSHYNSLLEKSYYRFKHDGFKSITFIMKKSFSFPDSPFVNKAKHLFFPQLQVREV